MTSNKTATRTSVLAQVRCPLVPHTPGFVLMPGCAHPASTRRNQPRISAAPNPSHKRLMEPTNARASKANCSCSRSFWPPERNTHLCTAASCSDGHIAGSDQRDRQNAQAWVKAINFNNLSPPNADGRGFQLSSSRKTQFRQNGTVR